MKCAPARAGKKLRRPLVQYNALYAFLDINNDDPGNKCSSIVTANRLICGKEGYHRRDDATKASACDELVSVEYKKKSGVFGNSRCSSEKFGDDC